MHRHAAHLHPARLASFAAMRKLTGALVLALVIPALALAAPAGRYKGRVTGDSGKVTFKVVGNKLKKFTIDGVGATCPSGFMLVTVYVPEAKIKRDGTFFRRYRPVQDVDQTITLKGRFSGGKASGTVKAGPLCVYKEKWTARKR
jgi:hypothetical protein